MPALHDYAPEGVLTINSIVMNCPAWSVCGDERGRNGLLQLVTAFRKRGENRLLPGVGGEIAYPKRRAPIELDFGLTVTGDVDALGAANSDSAEGLVENLQAIYDGIVEPVSGEDADSGTVAVTYVGLGVSLGGDVHVTAMEQDEYALGRKNGVSHQSLWIGFLTLSLPAGRFS